MDTRSSDQFALTLLIVIVFGLVLAFCTGCGSTWVEVPHPTPERMQELLNAPVPASKVRNATKFHLEVQRIVLWGNPVVVTCVVPEGRGRIRVALEGLASHGPVSIDSAQTILVVPAPPCGTWIATCDAATASGVKHDQVEVEVKGGMCEG